MFVLFNTNLNRVFKHPKVGVWWTAERAEADTLLDTMRDFVRAAGAPELAGGLVVQEISEDIQEIELRR